MKVRSLSYQEAVPRVIADFLVVHSSMIAALAVSVVYQVATGSGAEAQQLITDFERYYVRFFWILSPIFPLTFALLGFYTHTRSYGGRRKNRLILQGVFVGVILFFGQTGWSEYRTSVGAWLFLSPCWPVSAFVSRAF